MVGQYEHLYGSIKCKILIDNFDFQTNIFIVPIMNGKILLNYLPSYLINILIKSFNLQFLQQFQE